MWKMLSKRRNENLTRESHNRNSHFESMSHSYSSFTNNCARINVPGATTEWMMDGMSHRNAAAQRLFSQQQKNDVGHPVSEPCKKRWRLACMCVARPPRSTASGAALLFFFLFSNRRVSRSHVSSFNSQTRLILFLIIPMLAWDDVNVRCNYYCVVEVFSLWGRQTLVSWGGMGKRGECRRWFLILSSN